MCTGVRSTIVLDSLPPQDTWVSFQERSDRRVKVMELVDGRVHVECFSPVPCDHPDLIGALREISVSLRGELDALGRS